MQTWPTPYSCKLMEAGIISYEDSGAGIAYLTKQTIDRIAPSIIGRPVVIRHQKVTPENVNEVAVGYVTGVHFEASDAWFYVDFLITSDKVQPIDKDGCVVFKAPDGQILDGISGAYDVTNTAEGGVWHDIQFDAEILDGSFTHLALVVNPRYEETNKIRETNFMLVNGKVAKQSLNEKGDRHTRGECPACKGTGKDGHNDCNECRGVGTVRNAKMLCVECGTSFSHKNPSVETKCPKCHGYDLEVANDKDPGMVQYKGKEYYKTGKTGTRRSSGATAFEYESEDKWIVWRDMTGEVYENSKENASRDIMKSGNKCDIVALQDKFELVDKAGKRIMYADNLSIVKDAFSQYEETGKWNSKGGSAMKNLFKIFRKLANGKEEEVDKVVVIDGQEVPLKELVHTYEAEETEKAKKAELDLRSAKDDDEIEVGGKKVRVGDMKNCYTAKMAKKNAKADEDKEAEEKKEKENEKDEDKEKADKEEKMNASGRDAIYKMIKAGKSPDEIIKEMTSGEDAFSRAQVEKIIDGINEEAKNAKDEEDKKAAEEKEAEEKKNSKADGDKFFKQVENAGKGPVVEEAVGGPRTRQERADMGRSRYGSKQSK